MCTIGSVSRQVQEGAQGGVQEGVQRGAQGGVQEGGSGQAGGVAPLN